MITLNKNVYFLKIIKTRNQQSPRICDISDHIDMSEQVSYLPKSKAATSSIQ